MLSFLNKNTWNYIRVCKNGYYYEIKWRCPWCNGYRRRKWTRQHKFKSLTRLIAFHIALGKDMNPIILPPAMGKAD